MQDISPWGRLARPRVGVLIYRLPDWMGGGVNVRVAHKLGVGDAKGTEETVHTAALICLVAGLILCLICNIFAEPFLNILHTKSEFMDGAVLYFRIYALGLPALAITILERLF